MPASVRRRALVVVIVFAGALTAATSALAGNGGLLPVAPHSPNAHHIRQAFIFVLVFTGIVFVVVEGALIAFIIRYRRGKRPRTAEGAQIHGSTKLEIIWTVVPALILCAIGAFVFYLLPSIANAAAGGRRGRDHDHRRGPSVLLALPVPERSGVRRDDDRPGRRRRARERPLAAHGRRAQLVGARTRGQDRRHPRPREPHLVQGPGRRVRSALLRPLRDPARDDDGGRAGGPPRRLRAVHRRPRPRGGRHRARPGGVRARLRELPPARLAVRRPVSRRQPAAHRRGRPGNAPAPGRRAGCRPSAATGRTSRSTRSSPTRGRSGRGPRSDGRRRNPRRPLPRRLAPGPGDDVAHHRRPQADRDPLPRHGALLLRLRRCAGADDPHPARDPEREPPHPRLLQPGRHDPRHDDDLPRHRPDPRRLRQLPRPADDRRARHGLPAPERPLLLALPARRCHPRAQLLRQGRGRRGRLDLLRDALDAARARPRAGPVDPLAARADALVAHGGGQLHRHDHQHARARHDVDADPALRLGDAHVRLAARPRAADPLRGPDDDAARSQLRHPLLRPAPRRQPDPLPARLLVLRAPRGLHHGPARDGDRVGDHPGLRAQADLRLQGGRLLDRRDRIPRLPRLGPPHVRGRPADPPRLVLHGQLAGDRGSRPG